MTRPAWTDVAAVAQDQASNDVRIKGFRDNADARRIGFVGAFEPKAEVVYSTPGYQTFRWLPLPVPRAADYQSIARQFTVDVEVYNGASGGRIRLTDDETGTSGTPATIVGASYIWQPLTIAIPDSWLGTHRNIRIEVDPETSADIRIRMTDHVLGFVEF